MKKVFEEPVVEVNTFSAEDIITTSAPIGGDDDGPIL